jgi:hypothetical protein
VGKKHSCGIEAQTYLENYFIFRAVFFVAFPCIIYADAKLNFRARGMAYLAVITWMAAYGIWGYIFYQDFFNDEKNDCDELAKALFIGLWAVAIDAFPVVVIVFIFILWCLCVCF